MLTANDKKYLKKGHSIQEEKKKSSVFSSIKLVLSCMEGLVQSALISLLCIKYYKLDQQVLNFI